jgi:hypothetical protein
MKERTVLSLHSAPAHGDDDVAPGDYRIGEPQEAGVKNPLSVCL